MGREEGSGWGACVYLWQIHFDIWQNQYNIVKLKNKIKLKKKSRDITWSTEGCLVKAMVFPVVMYECEIWTIKKTEPIILSEVSQKEVHGLVQSRIKPDDVKNDAISQENDSVHQAEWYRYPDVLCFEPWDPTRVNVAGVNSMELL